MAIGEFIFTLSYGGVVIVLGVIMKIFIKKTYSSIYKKSFKYDEDLSNIHDTML